MCSGRASSTSSSPPATATAARYVAAWMRSATVRWSAAFSDPRSTPLTTMRDVPMPLMSAPMSTSRSHMSTTSGSRAALSIVVVPSANTAAVTMFSVAPTLGNENAMSAPCSRSAVACTSPWANLNDAPIASRPATCMSIGRAPKSSPPGIDRRTSPQRVSSGPSTLIDARIRSTSSYGATGTRSPSLSRISRPGSGLLRADAEGGEQLAHDRHVVDRRHVGELVLAVGEQARRHQLEHRVLRPGHSDRPLQRAEMADRDLRRGGGAPEAVHTDPPVCSGREGPRTRVARRPVVARRRRHRRARAVAT